MELKSFFVGKGGSISSADSSDSSELKVGVLKNFRSSG